MSVPVSAIHALLRSPEAQGINFSYDGHSVTGQRFIALSSHFSEVTIPHRIRVTTNPAIVGGPNSRTFARYDQFEDKINVRGDDILRTAEGRAGFLHECVHALQDRPGIDLRIQIAESMAYIAEAWYLLNSGPPASLDGLTPVIIAVARELRASYGAARIPGTPVAMSQEQYTRVRQSVISDYGYRTGYYDFNGIRGRRFQ